MLLAIHNGGSWNKEWRNYCINKKIEFLKVNCYDNNIIGQLKEKKVTHLMWHFSHNSPKDILMARNVLYSAAIMDIKTYPDFNTCWHFDDKVSQKYLLESINAPIACSYAFFDFTTAKNFLNEKASFPIVAKLRRGAGSYNVRLIKNYIAALKYIKRMFNYGIHPSPGYLADVNTKLKVAGSLKGILKRVRKAPNFFKVVHAGKKAFPKELGYAYFQEFIPNNVFDYRVKVVGDRCWAFKRRVRDNDFRASGSGMLDFSIKDIPIEMIRIAFDVSQKLKLQSVAFDFVLNESKPVILEISYGFGIDKGEAEGYWNPKLERIDQSFDPPSYILETFLK